MSKKSRLLERSCILCFRTLIEINKNTTLTLKKLPKTNFLIFTLTTVIYNRGKSMVISSRKFENFELFCPLGAMKRGVQQKKVTASDSVKPGPHIHIFFLSQRSRVSVEMGTKSEKVCVCV